MLAGLSGDYTGFNGPASGATGIVYLRPTGSTNDTGNTDHKLVTGSISSSGVEVKIAATALVVMAGVLLAMHLWTRGHQL